MNFVIKFWRIMSILNGKKKKTKVRRKSQVYQAYTPGYEANILVGMTA